jgi:hypothetical protein
MKMRKSALVAVCFAALALASPARAHHGVASVGVTGPEGPGAALETTSPLPLERGAFFALLKSEYVRFQQFAFAEPENKDFSSFSMLGLGYGITPWLSAYAFLPYTVKSQDAIGQNSGMGDPTLMLALGLKYDRGFQLAPEKESLDDLMDWHFSVWASSTIPLASTTHRTDDGEYFEPEMQTGFGEPSPAVGLAALKQISERFTWLADASYQHFFEHDYPETRYQFGAETRVNTAITYRVLDRGTLRTDLIAELNGLNLQRDREEDEQGGMQELQSSGGSILYAGGGVRIGRGPLSVTLGARRAALKDLNEASGQQGSEGLEDFRAAATFSWSMGP